MDDDYDVDSPITLVGQLIKEGGVGEHAHEAALVSWSHTEDRVTKRVTFAELAFIAGRISDALKAHGIRRGDPVAMLSHPTLDYFTTVAGVLSLGAIAVNINWRQPEESMQYMAALGRSTITLASAHFIKSGAAGRLLLGTGSARTHNVVLIDQLDKARLADTAKVARGLGHTVVPLFQDSDGSSQRDRRDGGFPLGQPDVAAVMFTRWDNQGKNKQKNVALT
jgi:acyl-CoA synthetase (AMP-forming)/AMP-acid ligase II